MKKITLSESEIQHLREFYEFELEKAKNRIASLTSVLSKLGEVSPSQEDEISKLLGATITPNKKTSKPVVKKVGKRGRPPKVKAESTIATPAEKVTKTAGTAKRGGASKKKTPVTKVQLAANKQQKPVAKKMATKRKPLKKGRGSKKMKWNEIVVDVIKNADTLLDMNSIAQKASEKLKMTEANFDRVKSSIATTLTKLAKTDKKLMVHKKAGSRARFYALPQWHSDSGELLPEYKKKMS